MQAIFFTHIRDLFFFVLDDDVVNITETPKLNYKVLGSSLSEDVRPLLII
jgi:hypothetical protein